MNASAPDIPAALRRQFASDNYAGICPEAWRALEEANCGHAPGYGEDPWTARASDLIREVLETDCEVFFVFNGTSANSLALAAMCRSYHSILCHSMAHIESDECGAPEFFAGGTKLVALPGTNGKLDPATVREAVNKREGDLHSPKPRALSLTQTTECGTVYTPQEVGALSATAHELGLDVHMDGARFANAIASLNVSPADVTWRAGVDALCFGATKNGAPVGEAVVFFKRELAREFEYRCKQAGQLASKMRFLTAPWVGLLEDGAWLRHAQHANACAARLEAALSAVPGVKLLFPRQANAVFIELALTHAEALRARGWKFYTFIGDSGQRLMCAWDTQESDVDAFVADVLAVTGQSL